ncbi:AKR1 [Candida pseudojiufengensis]|uniref:AKR1 n=1 Tax=Candida pseudojiufengensis TaxID=497109 RepID=UPI002224C324|nr:AKR1 [Candida pseudojiufengensis]KAI5966780.1 AKR1 [Candida pseudojiufengensis]
MSSFILKWITNRLIKDNQWNKFGVEDPYYEYVVTNINRKGEKKYKKVERKIPQGIDEHDIKILKLFKKRAYRYDYWFSIFGVQFGWTNLVSIVPIFGTIVQTFWSLQLLYLAKQITDGLPLDLQLLFLLNIAIDFGLGLIPIVGSIIEIGYKANSRNYLLLEKHLTRVGEKNMGIISKEEVRPGYINDTVQPYIDDKVKPYIDDKVIPYIDETIKPNAIKAGEQILDLLHRKPRSTSTSSEASTANSSSAYTTQTSNTTAVYTTSNPRVSSGTNEKFKNDDATITNESGNGSLNSKDDSKSIRIIQLQNFDLKSLKIKSIASISPSNILYVQFITEIPYVMIHEEENGGRSFTETEHQELSNNTSEVESFSKQNLDSIELNKLKDKNIDSEISKNEELLDSASINSTDAVIESNVNGDSHDVRTDLESNSKLAQFMQSCQEGSIDLVKQLIGSKDVSVNETFQDGITGLHWACINNRLTLVKYLIENGADPNLYGGELKATPLHWACRNGLVYIVDYLISESSADPKLRDIQNYDSLHLAVHSSNIMLVIYLLVSCCDTNKLYIDEPDGSNRTALHWASYQNDIFTINALLKFGADVTKVDDNLFTPLHWCFMRGYKTVMKTLVEAGSDIFVKNDQNKDSFEVAQDMNCLTTWKKVLIECGRDPKTWKPKTNIIQPKMGKILTFLAPYILLPISLKLCTTSQSLAIPKLIFSLSFFAFGIYLVNKIIIPTYLIDDKPLPKSPILAGVFSATAFWCIIVWAYNIVPRLFFSNFITNLLLTVVIVTFVWSFFKAMFINPGFVPTPTDSSIILSQIKDLINVGKFDTDHFCVNTLIKKPLRSRYSRHNNKLVARFDHYCPWVYNEIGVRNHKLFITFVYSLNVAILLFTYLSIRYFDKLKDSYDSDDEDESLFCQMIGDDLCFGYKNHPFHFNLMVWCLLQYIWILILCVVQTFQILRGLTTWEFSSLNSQISNSRRFNHSTVPNEVVADSITQPPSQKTTELQTCLNLLGIDQFILTVKMSIASLLRRNNNESTVDPLRIEIPTDYGFKQNWLDFWIIGDANWRNVFYLPIEGENNLNGQVVDYYKLYEYPPKKSTQVV